jgi:hypothetical protein
MQTAIVILLVVLSALFAAGRLLPGTFVERALTAFAGVHPSLGRAARWVTGRRAGTAGASLAGACSSCAATGTHPKSSLETDSSVNR